MTDRIRTAFSAVRAEEALKETTILRLRQRVQDGARPRRTPARRLALVVCLLLLVAGLFSHRFYFTEAAYVDLDINPSLALTVNRAGRIIGASAYNPEGEELLSGLNLRRKKVDAALNELIAVTARTGILREDGLVSVTVQSISGDETERLTAIRAGVETAASHHGGAQVQVFPVDADTRSLAWNLQVSPAKYLAILELQEVDPTATVDGCRGHTIGEIQQWTQKHGAGHHDGQGETVSDADTAGGTAAGAGGENSGGGHHGQQGHG